MRAVEIYEKETGNKQPSNQIAYHEWRIEYVRWLEQQVVKFFAIPNALGQSEQFYCYEQIEYKNAKCEKQCKDCKRFEVDGQQ